MRFLKTKVFSLKFIVQSSNGIFDSLYCVIMGNYIYGAMLIIGLTLLFFSIITYRKTKELLHSGTKTNAVVTELIRMSSDDGYTYKPVFEYKDRQQNVRTYTSQVSRSPPAYQVGENVQIVYDQIEEEVMVISFWGLYRWPVILLSIASPLLIIGCCYFLYSYN